MDIYQKKARWKWYLAGAGAVIVIISMFYTKYLTDRLKVEETKKVEQVKRALETLSLPVMDTTLLNCDVSFQTAFLETNTTIPVLLVDGNGSPQEGRNFGAKNDTNSVFLNQKLKEFKASGKQPIEVIIFGEPQYLYFEHSFILTLLTYYPVVQLVLISAFIAFGYLGFSSARRAEQNRVWVGMAKETAHQLGTPISGIIAWIEHLQGLREDDQESLDVLDELRNDVTRLELIADRFSKIGSAPELKEVNIYDELERCRQYMQRRASRKIVFEFPDPAAQTPLTAHINSHLFDWVVENLIRNALDAMEQGVGKISAAIFEDADSVYLDIRDTGKGIPTNKFKTVFQPGYTTKKRGWGLGLSLAKRIIEDYHSGRIFVKKSTPTEGTTFTIQLPK